ncbi:hypothetical protein [Chitinophaga sp. Cy-1792]|uniref:hypothetical protein n=1 Tax=Chitinophaga sp. Cy-1792 TaxID=2608339 RepID=UPI001421F368|nr:hypothetical protein [Chitinophaga sp. Cy-1792]NIG54135.1 hypothetical protein [Chitinophaga sp. Cy-1792]
METEQSMTLPQGIRVKNLASRLNKAAAKVDTAVLRVNKALVKIDREALYISDGVIRIDAGILQIDPYLLEVAATGENAEMLYQQLKAAINELSDRMDNIDAQIACMELRMNYTESMLSDGKETKNTFNADISRIKQVAVPDSGYVKSLGNRLGAMKGVLVALANKIDVVEKRLVLVDEKIEAIIFVIKPEY